ncbi:MAG: nucleotidyltransferase domain-containing protein [Thiohalomonadaceae bacterium]
MACIERQPADALAAVFEQFPSVQAAYLFGSRAAGTAGPASDFDLALVGGRAELQAQKLDILAALVAAGFERADLVLLDGADPFMQFEAVHHNCLIFARPGFDRGAYYSRVVRMYFDFEPYLRIQREAMKQRLAHGQA